MKVVRMPLIKNQIPILEYDTANEGLIHAPHHIRPITPTPYCVIVFFQDVIDRWNAEGKLTHLTDLKSEAGKHPVYLLDVAGSFVGVLHPMLGGPFAAGFMEELIALGFTKFIACGGAGVLRKDIVLGQFVVPTKALRQEGVSYQYLPPSRTIEIHSKAVEAIRFTLRHAGIPFLEGMTWTTDAFYRETKEMIEYRREEGCLTVEMECASFAAVAAFRGVIFGQILYGGDDVSQAEWNSRKWQSRLDVRNDLVLLAAQAALRL
jgi:uridine phosphorylase